ncbi:MAG TPA: hypothetical protein VMZ53_13650 [Kofleriaceae bacterium]|nr:hypothetical protein [Kofleriaceae bacterium]
MRFAIVIVIAAFVLAATVTAGNRKVFVLPVDGNAPNAQRIGINDAIVSLAKTGMDGDVSSGDTTFNETAAAVGCTPDQASCAETVMTTLAVDELVWGTAQTENGSTTVTVHRMAKGESPREQKSVIPESANGLAVSTGLTPLFSRDQGIGSAEGSDAGSGSAAVERPRPKSFFDTTERKLGVGLGAASVTCLIIGFSLWSSESGLQDQIDAHPRDTLGQLQDLHELEDRAASKALWGNVFVVLGVAAGGVSGYYFWKDHKNRSERTTVIAPVPTADGTGVKMVLGGRW